jgi:protein-S-isoprenylcysteine O-methyltransferase Ste14
LGSGPDRRRLDYTWDLGGPGAPIRIRLFQSQPAQSQFKYLIGFNTQTANIGLGVDYKEEEMHLFDQRILGIGILLLLSLLVIIKQKATGSVLDRPKGNFLIQLVNGFNLFFLLIVNPLTAIFLLTRRIEIIVPFRLIIDNSGIILVLEIIGLVMYVMGYLLMAQALITLGDNYQLGGSAPRSENKMVIEGLYKLVRHPMYTAALTISLGLTCLIQSWAFLGVFGIYLVLIILLIPVEEDGLKKAYGEQYILYRQKAKKLIPFVY